eukprot:scaffold7055_cov254-Pinguiococcus_pyrenoidosus.AAC.9
MMLHVLRDTLTSSEKIRNVKKDCKKEPQESCPTHRKLTMTHLWQLPRHANLQVHQRRDAFGARLQVDEEGEVAASIDVFQDRRHRPKQQTKQSAQRVATRRVPS